MSKPKILVIVEDRKRGSELTKRILKLFKIRYRVYEFETNIYTLFKKIKDYDFNADIKSVLKEFHPEHKTLLKNDFAFTYLLFDGDLHHSFKDDKRTLDEIVNDNFKILKQMIKYFNNETDPTIGKLYIDYPMLEAYRFCNDFFDDSYRDARVLVKDIARFKSISGNTPIAYKHIDDFKKREISSLILQNIFKINYISTLQWEKPTFKDYIKLSNNQSILKKQENFKKQNDAIQVLNTSFLIVVDYYGNRDSFYDKRLVSFYHYSTKNNGV